MAERRVGVVPSVNALAEDQTDYAMLVTDRRLVFISKSAPSGRAKDFLREMFLGGGEAIREEIDYRSTPIDSLASMSGSRTIALSSVRKVKFGTLLGNYDLTVEYEGEDGKALLLSVALNPTDELVKANKAQGVSKKETKKQYALKCQELMKRVVTPMVSSEARWIE